MSADGYSICPQCIDNFQASQQKLNDQITRDYGKIPHQEYEALLDLREPQPNDEQFRTVREYYETYLDGWTLTYRYSGYCECGYEFTLPDQVWDTRPEEKT